MNLKLLCRVKKSEDTEIEVYKDEHNLCLEVNPFHSMNTLYVHIAGKKISNNIREKLSSTYNIKCTHNMHIKNLSVKFVSRYDNMTYRHQLQQPRPSIESKMVKHIKYMSHEEQINNYNFLNSKMG